MLAERLNVLLSLLQCSNTELAGYIHCSPSHISHIKAGSRVLKKGGRSVRRLSEGLYRYAAEENMLPELCQLLKTEETSPEAVVPTIIDWLYESVPWAALCTEKGVTIATPSDLYS